MHTIAHMRDVVREDVRRLEPLAKGLGTCDLIAISTHGRSGLERWVMGSVTERVLNATKLPMLIVRPQKKA